MQLLLLSGGLESSAIAAWLRPRLSLTVDYGQLPASGEIWAASRVCAELGLEHHSLSIDCSTIGSGLMAGLGGDPQAPIPEWWPFRNQLLVTFAGAWGISRGVKEILVGSVSGDGTHVDGTASFYGALDQVVALQEGNVRVSAPAIDMSSAELIETSDVDDAVLGWTHSCHVASVACGSCPGCTKRRAVLQALGRLP